MAKLVYTANVSLDGFIEDERGEIGWSEPSDEVFAFFVEYERPKGLHIYGRRMYEAMAYWETNGDGPGDSAAHREFAEIWRAKEKLVYSRTLERASSARTRIERRLDPEAVRQLKRDSDADLTIGGAEIGGQAIAAGLVDEIHLLVAPVLIGAGKPALPAGVRVGLELLGAHRFDDGIVDLHYGVGDPRGARREVP